MIKTITKLLLTTVVLMPPIKTIAAGTTTFNPISAVQPRNDGTFISNCSTSRSSNHLDIKPCITAPKCGTGKWFFIPITNPNHDALVSVSLTSFAAQKPVRIVGNHSCSAHGDEAVSYINLTN